MQFASVLVEEKKEVVLRASSESPFVLWRELCSQIKEPSISADWSLRDLIENSSLVLSSLKKNALKLSSCEEVVPKDFLLPFEPKQFRDFYCFEEHVGAGRKKRGLEIPPEWYDFPVFYFSNATSFVGPNERVEGPALSSELDFELEVACVIGKKIKNASLEEARDAIFAYSLLNDWSARDLQRKEMKLNLGPAKGKDFATSFGPILVTPDELEPLKKGKGYDIKLEAYINDKLITSNNWSTIHYSFEEMIVHASKDAWLYPGEVLGSGTVGGGCFLEINLSREKKQWLKAGDDLRLQWSSDSNALQNLIV